MERTKKKPHICLSLYVITLTVFLVPFPLSVIVIQRSQFHFLFQRKPQKIFVKYFQISLAWKGIRLERRYGTIGFTCLLIFFTLSSGIVYAALAQVNSHFKFFKAKS